MPQLHRQSLVAARLVLVVGGRLVPQALRMLFHFEKLSRGYLICLNYLIGGFPTGQAWFSRLKKKGEGEKSCGELLHPERSHVLGIFLGVCWELLTSVAGSRLPQS